MATMMLADQGAEVIKVESPRGGDLTRALGGAARGLAPIFATTNRNKKSVAVNLKDPRGVELIGQLVTGADVFVQNLRPGKAEDMGLSEQRLRALKPDLIYVSINGFGESGPYSHKRAYDPVIQALSGLASIQADGETGRPRMFRLIVPDKVTALTAAQAITAALLERERSLKGQHVRLSMLDAVIAFMWPEGMARYTFIGPDIKASKPRDTRDLIFETRDGFITVGAVSDREWQGLIRALSKPEWLDDDRFKSPAGRVKHADARLELTASVLVGNTSDYWIRRLEAEQVPCAPILSREEIIEDPQVAANALIEESEHPSAGRMRQTRPAARFERTPSTNRLQAPLLGEHTDEVLSGLGMTPTDLTKLRQAGVIG